MDVYRQTTDPGQLSPGAEQRPADLDQELLEATLERIQSMEALAERILSECRVQLMMSFRFMDRALWKMPFRSLRLRNLPSNVAVQPRSMLATDGHTLHHNAKAVIGSFRRNPNLVARAYLHTVLHCIFRHPFHTVRTDMGLWSLACDICVEAIALEMCHGRFALEGDDLMQRVVHRVNDLCGGLAPAKIYRALMLGKNEEACTREQLLIIAELNGSGDMFARDDHQLWDLVEPPRDEEQRQPLRGGDGDADQSEGGNEGEQPESPDDANQGDVGGEGEDSDAEPPEDAETPEGDEAGEGDGQEEPGDDPSDEQSAPGQNQPAPSDAGAPPPPQQNAGAFEPEYSEAEQLGVPEPADEDEDDEGDWEQIAQQVETALQTMEKEHGDGAGTFMGNLALANRSRINYEDFLRRFATRAEDAKLNDEEFDYIFYTYGLRLYENMPLVEPLEYTETERIREFVIAIDTSGSCSQGLVEVFLTRTYEILSRSKGFDDQVNVHIVQCDADIQEDIVIHGISDLAEYERGFTVKGYGGTDFRPVFAYVDDLVAKKEFADLRGLVYFTDGYGTFPATSPDYDVAFVFVEEDGKERRVPPWAMKVVLDEDTLYEMGADFQGTHP